LFQVWDFVQELAKWAVAAEFFPKEVRSYGPLESYLAWLGPKLTLRAFKGDLVGVNSNAIPPPSEFYEQFCIMMRLGCLMLQSRVENRCEILVSTKPHSFFLKSLKCMTCNKSSQQSLMWSESNWSFLRGIFPPSQLYNILHLGREGINRGLVEEVCRNTSYSDLVGEAFNMPARWEGSSRRGHWLCTACLEKYLRDNIGQVFEDRHICYSDSEPTLDPCSDSDSWSLPWMIRRVYAYMGL